MIPYPMNQVPGKTPVPDGAEPCQGPSIDSYIPERDHWTVAHLPDEVKKQFGENVHRYIRQLGKDYLNEDDDGTS
jgi:hypothetical protein